MHMQSFGLVPLNSYSLLWVKVLMMQQHFSSFQSRLHDMVSWCDDSFNNYLISLLLSITVMMCTSFMEQMLKPCGINSR